jgi:hypothetical protein
MESFEGRSLVLCLDWFPQFHLFGNFVLGLKLRVWSINEQDELNSYALLMQFFCHLAIVHIALQFLFHFALMITMQLAYVLMLTVLLYWQEDQLRALLHVPLQWGTHHSQVLNSLRLVSNLSWTRPFSVCKISIRIMLHDAIKTCLNLIWLLAVSNIQALICFWQHARLLLLHLLSRMVVVLSLEELAPLLLKVLLLALFVQTAET